MISSSTCPLRYSKCLIVGEHCGSGVSGVPLLEGTALQTKPQSQDGTRNKLDCTSAAALAREKMEAGWPVLQRLLPQRRLSWQTLAPETETRFKEEKGKYI